MPNATPWNNAAILRRLEAAEVALLVAKNAAASWKAGTLLANESPVAHVVASNAVEAGIAAADVICEIQLRAHSTTHNHNDAISMLRQVDRAAADLLRSLIDAKNIAQYSPDLMNLTNAKTLVNQARNIYDNARQRALNQGLAVKRQSPKPVT